jgi:putative DNA primase/helicase
MDDKTVVGFPAPSGQRPDPEELIRRQKAEAERLARLGPIEYPLWIDDSAERLGIPRARLEAAIRALIAQQEKAKREAKAEERRAQARAEKAAAARRKEKERVFKVLDALPEEEQEKRLDEIARRLDEDPAVVREEFETSSSPPIDSGPELWPEAVETAKLLQELVDQIKRFIVVHDDGAVAVALWTMMAWAHNAVATHSPILVITSAEPDSGKTMLLGVLAQLTPHPLSGAELTGPALFRIVDRDHPTLLVDEADDLFHRKPDLRHIVNAGWSRGTKVPRMVQGVTHWFDPFCPKIIGLKGMQMPPTTASRGIVIKLWPRLDEEKIEDFAFTDSPEFQELRRKLMRWGADNSIALGDSKPTMPAEFRNRLAANWRLLFATADLAGGAWPKRARQAAIRLSQKASEPSVGRRLLEALHEILVNRGEMTSAAMVGALTANPDSEWREYKGRAPITQRQIAALLRSYDIRPVVLHPTKRAALSAHGYRRVQFADVFARFLPSDPNIRTSGAKRK